MSDMKQSENKKIKFLYEKGPTYRTTKADGVIGGVSPKGKIFMDFFNEKPPFPKSIVNVVNADGSLGNEIEREAEIGITREVEFGVFLDIETAMIVAEWLNNRVQDYKKSIAQKD